jgi:hypothetical protein
MCFVKESLECIWDIDFLMNPCVIIVIYIPNFYSEIFPLSPFVNIDILKNHENSITLFLLVNLVCPYWYWFEFYGPLQFALLLLV